MHDGHRQPQRADHQPARYQWLRQELQRWQFSAILGLNTLFVALMAHPQFKKVDFSASGNQFGRHRAGFGGGRALEKHDRLHRRRGYGLTETSPVVCANPHGEHSRLGTVGLPVPGTTLKVIDDEGNALPLGERGELCVKGPQVMKGYWQRPEATAEVLDEEGWLRTGDIAVIDRDGFVSIVDRKKDLIIVSGFNVYPNEIEDVVMAHPKVAACAAIGVADEKSGEAVKLFVVPSDPTLTQEELHAYCRENFTGYKMPRHYVFRDALPMTPVGRSCAGSCAKAPDGASSAPVADRNEVTGIFVPVTLCQASFADSIRSPAKLLTRERFCPISGTKVNKSQQNSCHRAVIKRLLRSGVHDR